MKFFKMNGTITQQKNVNEVVKTKVTYPRSESDLWARALMMANRLRPSGAESFTEWSYPPSSYTNNR